MSRSIFFGNRKSLGKKSEITFKEIMFMFARLLILLIIFFSIIFITKKYIIVTSDISKTEAEIMLRSIMSNKNSVIYYDEAIGRTYPYVMDVKKFDGNYDPKLEKAFNFGKEQRAFAAKITLFGIDEKPYQYNGKATVPVYINKPNYKVWIDMARTGFLGPGAATEKTKKYYVNVMDDATLKPGIIEVSLVIPNS
jgi:hypothetical protein